MTRLCKIQKRLFKIHIPRDDILNDVIKRHMKRHQFCLLKIRKLKKRELVSKNVFSLFLDINHNFAHNKSLSFFFHEQKEFISASLMFGRYGLFFGLFFGLFVDFFFGLHVRTFNPYEVRNFFNGKFFFPNSTFSATRNFSR